MKTVFGNVKKCPRCETKFKKGEEQHCNNPKCTWPWPEEGSIEILKKRAGIKD